MMLSQTDVQKHFLRFRVDNMRPLKNAHIVIASEAKQSHKILIIHEIASSFHSSQ